MKNFQRLLLVATTSVLISCGVEQDDSAGFTLPEGNVERGKENYVAFGCNACHDSEAVPQLGGTAAPVISVVLGGETTRVRTYGELVTSIINPSHKVARRSSSDMADESGKSRMVTSNDIMTVTQLVDLVSFVESSYELSPYNNTAYPIYWIPEPEEASATDQ